MICLLEVSTSQQRRVGGSNNNNSNNNNNVSLYSTPWPGEEDVRLFDGARYRVNSVPDYYYIIVRYTLKATQQRMIVYRLIHSMRCCRYYYRYVIMFFVIMSYRVISLL